MKTIGWTLVVAGIGLVFWAWVTPTSVHTDMDYVPGLGLQEARDTLNLGLLQTQMMLLECGLAAIIAGTIATCFGELKDAMLRAGSAKDPPPIEYEPKANAG
jgi:hypothetical protein